MKEDNPGQNALSFVEQKVQEAIELLESVGFDVSITTPTIDGANLMIQHINEPLKIVCAGVPIEIHDWIEECPNLLIRGQEGNRKLPWLRVSKVVSGNPEEEEAADEPKIIKGDSHDRIE